MTTLPNPPAPAYPRLELVGSRETAPPVDNPPDTRVEQIRYALRCARTARAWLREAGADNAARYVARAIKSVEGAERHALRLENETRERD